MSKKSNYFISFVFVFFLDQVTKWWARGAGIVTFNSGISFSLFEGFSGWIYVVVTLVLLVVMGKWLWSVWSKHLWMFGMLSGGAVSNASDRIFFSGVQDFLPVPFLGVKNNLADWVIFGCLVWVGWEVWRGRRAH